MKIGNVERIKIDKKGETTLRGKKLENVFPIGAPYSCPDDGWELKHDFQKKIPKNAKYFAFRLTEMKFPDFRGNYFDIAAIQFYGQKENEK